MFKLIRILKFFAALLILEFST